MRISCPNCDAAYEVPETALAAGPRRLRCARCGHQFQAALPGAAPSRAEPPPASAPMPGQAEAPRPEPAAPAVPPPAPPRRLAEKMAADKPPSGPAPRPAPAPPPIPNPLSHGRLRDAPASPPDRFAMAGWVLTIAVLGLAGYVAYVFRADIIAAWPPALRVYALLGLA